MDLHQGIPDGLTEFVDHVIGFESANFERDLASQRVAVGVQAVGWQPETGIAIPNRGAVNDLRFVDDADNEPGQIIFARLVHIRQFGHLATDQSDAVFFARAGKTVDHFDDRIRLEFADTDVIEEKQPTGTVHKNIVNTMIDQVGTDGTVAIGHVGQFEFGSHAIGGRDKYRLGKSAQFGGKEAAERAEAGQNLRVEG